MLFHRAHYNNAKPHSLRVSSGIHVIFTCEYLSYQIMLNTVIYIYIFIYIYMNVFYFLNTYYL